jgi:23S rRNA pseudouridine1911/1915/1917 synthase
MNEFKNIALRLPDGHKQKITLIYEDPFLLVVNKPPGVRVIPDRWDKHLPNLLDLINVQLEKSGEKNSPKIWVVHRIDADTTGIVLFAKNKEVHRILNSDFEKNRISKTYLAIVQGHPPQEKGTIDLPLLTGRKGRVRVDDSGKPSITHYLVLEFFKQYSLLEVTPQTGRTHQIRVHLQAIGHPLAVDPVYSETQKLTIFDLKKGNYQQNKIDSVLISRLTLHAWKLSVNHPVKELPMEWQAEPPGDFQAFLKALRKWNAVS